MKSKPQWLKNHEGLKKKKQSISLRKSAADTWWKGVEERGREANERDAMQEEDHSPAVMRSVKIWALVNGTRKVVGSKKVIDI